MVERLETLLSTWVAITNAIFLTALLITMGYALARQSPYRLLSYDVSPVRAGDVATFISKVWRDKTRDCSVDVHRSLIFSDLSEYNLPRQEFSDQSIDDMEMEHAGRGIVRVPIPMWAPPGESRMRSVLFYRCNWTQSLLPPIEVTIYRNFLILPPA